MNNGRIAIALSDLETGNGIYMDSLQSNINIGAHTFFEDANTPEGFLKNILNHSPESLVQLTIGKFCAISSGVKFIMEGTSPRADWVSAYPFQRFPEIWSSFDSDAEPWFKRQHIDIGNDVTIGYEAIIMPGVSIGHGAIIHTRAVVAKDIPPYAIVGGNPASVLRMRYPEYIVERLLEIAWWNWHPDKIARHLHLLAGGNVQRLLEVAD